MNSSEGQESKVATSVGATRDELLTEVVSAFTATLTAVGFTATEIENAVVQQLAIGSATMVANVLTLGQEQRDCMEAMCAWRREPRFAGPDGLPRPLVVDGVENSFRDLVESIRPSADYRSALDALLRFKAVRMLPGNRVEALTPTFILGGGGAPVACDGVLKQMAGYLGVVRHNVTRGASDRSARFERSCTVPIPIEVRAIAERMIADRGQIFIDALDEHLMRLGNTPSRTGRFVELGVGAYSIDLGSVRSRSI